jgi:hypothetical protein
MINLCRTKDPTYFYYLYFNLLEANWKVLLSNGEIIYQDDYLNAQAGELNPVSAWQRLQLYCAQNSLRPVHFTLEYGDNILDILPLNAEGYYFRRGFITEMTIATGATENTSFTGKRSKKFVIGYFDKTKDLLYTYDYKIPELGLWDTDVRDDAKRRIDRCNLGNSLFMVNYELEKNHEKDEEKIS